MRSPLGAALLLIGLAAPAGPARSLPDGPAPGVYRIDPGGSELSYEVRHPLHMVRGTSRDVRGSLRLSEAPPWLETPCRLAAPLLAFSSRNRNRDSNALAALGAARFPEAIIEVRLVKVDPEAAGRTSVGPSPPTWIRAGVAEADLTVRGVKRPVAVTWTANRTGDRSLAVEARFAFSLADHGIPRPALFLVPVDDRVEIACRLALHRARPAGEVP